MPFISAHAVDAIHKYPPAGEVDAIYKGGGCSSTLRCLRTVATITPGIFESVLDDVSIGVDAAIASVNFYNIVNNLLSNRSCTTHDGALPQ